MSARPPSLDPVAVGPEEQLLIDENQLAQGHEFFELGDWEVSPDHRFIAYSIDTTGYEVYDVVVLDIETGNILGPLSCLLFPVDFRRFLSCDSL